MNPSLVTLEEDRDRLASIPAIGGQVVDDLAALAREIGSDDLTLTSLSQLAAGALVVVAGQQPGICGGPLLSILKTIEAIRIAERLREVEISAVPLFWNASTDHDLDEMNRLFMSSGDGLTVDRFRFEGWSRGPSAVDCVFSAQHVAALTLWLSDHNQTLTHDESPVSGESLARWQSRLMTHWFSGTGLIVLEADRMMAFDFELKTKVLRHTARIKGALRAQQSMSPERSAVIEIPRESFLFRQGPPRQRVSVTDDGCPLQPAGPHHIDDWMAEHGANTSGDVLGRVLTQQALLPTAYQVVGPTEGRYLQEAKGVLDLMGLPQVSQQSRPSCCLLNAGQVAEFAEMGVASENATHLERWPAPPSKAPSRRRRKKGGDAPAEDQLAATRRRQQRKRLSEWVRPRGRPQERVFSLVSLASDRPRAVRWLMSQTYNQDQGQVVVLPENMDE